MAARSAGKARVAAINNRALRLQFAKSRLEADTILPSDIGGFFRRDALRATRGDQFADEPLQSAQLWGNGCSSFAAGLAVALEARTIGICLEVHASPPSERGGKRRVNPSSRKRAVVWVLPQYGPQREASA